MASIPAHWLMTTPRQNQSSLETPRSTTTTSISSSPRMGLSLSPPVPQQRPLSGLLASVPPRIWDNTLIRELVPKRHAAFRGGKKKLHAAFCTIQKRHAALAQALYQVSRKLHLTTEAHDELKSFSQLMTRLLPMCPRAMGPCPESWCTSRSIRPGDSLLRSRNDKSKFTVIKGRARDKESLGDVRDPSEPVPAGEGIHKDALTIVVLRQRILAVGAKVAPDVKVSLEMAGRVAYLRFHYQGKVNQGKPKAPSFWDDIDAGLADVRGATGEAVEAMSL
ncbi:hypothetical protein DFH09DRAFT_1113676 [Mycena vulgaris]|nr:hypothetical protein DFH09DRAFT_1113676 [Mycena vulgaris]